MRRRVYCGVQQALARFVSVGAMLVRGNEGSALPPGPRWPSSVQTLAWMTRPKPFLRRAHERYGDMFSVRLRTGETFVMLADPDAVKQVFTGDPEVFRAGEGNRILLPLLGKHSVLLLDGREHLRQRRLLLPPFHGERMQRYREIMEEETEREVATWRAGEPVQLARRMQSVTLEVIMRTVFGVTGREELGHLRRVLLDMLDWTTVPRRFVVLAALSAERLAKYEPFQRVVRPVDDALLREIARRRGAPDLAEREDILSLLLQARDEDGEGLTDAELRDELLTLLLAGHETTATALGWAFERLLRCPEALGRATEDARSGDGAYLDAVAKETLRLKPVLPIVARRLREPVTIGGVDLPAGTDVAPCIYLVHHREDLYPEPDAFRPERFLGVTPGTYTWLPFGGGVRRCIGASFALFELQVVLGTVLRSVALHAAEPAFEPTARRTITLVPGRGAEAVPSRAA
jgi:cytochrome P450